MRAIIVLEYDAETPDEFEAIATKVRREIPIRGLCAIRVATGDVADQIVDSFVIEGQPKRKP